MCLVFRANLIFDKLISSLEIKLVAGRRYKNWLNFRRNCEFEKRLNHNLFLVFALYFVRNIKSSYYELAQAGFFY